MNTTALHPGDQLIARVTQHTPFGVLVVRVESFDAEKVRFSAVLADIEGWSSRLLDHPLV